MKILTFLKVILIGLCFTSCHEEWLDVKRDKMQVVPQTLKDFQALLDNQTVMNRARTPSLGEVSADDYFITSENWDAIRNSGTAGYQKKAFVWAENIYTEGDRVFDWETPYQMVFYANVALEGIAKIEPESHEINDWNNIKGSALFYRAWAFYQLAQIFCKQYDPNTAKADLGIPLRLESDINITSKRATVHQTYTRIIDDIQTSIPLLPNMPVERTRPGKAAAHAFLAKTYLQMGDYENGLASANESLKLYDELMDYNTVDVTASRPFELFNEEVVFHTSMYYASGPLTSSRLVIDPQLYQSYDDNDLRKTGFYRDNNGALTFKGSYTQAVDLFTGIATDEIYLIRAECYARDGNIPDALASLSALQENRFTPGTFVSPTANNPEEALTMILEERRKELVFRGIRWSDLRRLNKDPRFAKTLTRNLNGEIYTLPPGDPRYVLPIPSDVIVLTGMQQNSR